MRGQIESQYGSMTRQKVKRQLLDQLDELYQFDTPQGLVDAEFDNIWRQINTDLEQAGKTFADEDTTEEEARAEYRKLAERRVRLGLVLSEIGEKAGVTVSDEEMQRSLFQQLRQFPARKSRSSTISRRPGCAASLRAPLFEEKVVDHLLGEVSVTDKTVSKDELMADDEDDSAEKPAKKAAPKKKAAKAETADAAEGAQAEEAAAPKKKAASKKKAAAEDSAE